MGSQENKFLSRENLRKIVSPVLFEEMHYLCTLAVTGFSHLERKTAMDLLNEIFDGPVQINQILTNQTTSIYFTKENLHFWYYVTEIPCFYRTFADDDGDINYVCMN